MCPGHRFCEAILETCVLRSSKETHEVEVTISVEVLVTKQIAEYFGMFVIGIIEFFISTETCSLKHLIGVEVIEMILIIIEISSCCSWLLRQWRMAWIVYGFLMERGCFLGFVLVWCLQASVVVHCDLMYFNCRFLFLLFDGIDKVLLFLV